MADKTLSSVIGSSAGVLLAADLNYIANTTAGRNTISVTGIDGSSGFATALSLSGKHLISFMEFSGLISESMTMKLTIDGDEKWSSSRVMTTTEPIFGKRGTSFSVAESIQCNTSLLMEIQTTTDTSVDFEYNARPIL